MKNIHILSLLAALVFTTNTFSANNASQADESAPKRPVFTVHTLEARGEANYCCEGSEADRALHETPQYLARISPTERARLERLKRENIRSCCGWPYPSESGKEATSHVITIIKNPHKPEESETLITPLNPHGVETSEKLWEKRRGLFFKDQPLDNGASFAQNPVTDSDIKYLGGSFDQQGLYIQLAMNNECQASRLSDRSLGKNKIETSVFVRCPNATYYLRNLAKKSVDELVKKHEWKLKQ